MKELSLELVQLLNFLLPGFVARWVFHGLTAFKRFDNFERVVEALIFTAITQAILLPLKGTFLAIGNRLVDRGWTPIPWYSQYELTYSIVLSVLVGVVAAGLANNDILHRWLRNRHLWLLRHNDSEEWKWRNWRWTKRTSTPSQWYASFSKFPAWVVLHLENDERRLYGWAEEWPDHPDEGHFALLHAQWLVGTKQVQIPNTEALLISVKTVRMIEFVHCPNNEAPESFWSSFLDKVAFYRRFQHGNQRPGLPAGRQPPTAPAAPAAPTPSTNGAAPKVDDFID